MRSVLRSVVAVLLVQAGNCTAPLAGFCDGLWGPGPHFEVYTGGDYAVNAADLTTTAIWSPFSPVTEPCIRLKLDGLASLFGAGSTSIGSGAFLPQGMNALADAMVGYQFDLQSVRFKAYAGGAYQQQVLIFTDIGATAQRASWSAAAALDSWWRPTERIWNATDFFVSAKMANVYTKVGYELHRADNGLVVSFGGEAAITAADANVYKEGRDLGLFNDYLRAGGLVCLRFGTHELTLSGGLSEASNEIGWRPYATISYGKKF